MPRGIEPRSGLPMPSRRARLAASLGALTMAAGLAACSSPTPAASPLPTPTGSASPSPSAKPSSTPSPKPPEPTTSPLSGRKGGVDTPVIVVKLDNTPSAQPHIGLTAADVVYIEPVEWGVTRLAAVFSTSVPENVGPVRSARVSDIDMLAPYGNVAFVFSGAQKRLWPAIQQANWIPVSEDISSPGFYRNPTRSAPFNLMARPRQMLAANPDAAVAKDMGLVFDADPPSGGRTATTVTATWPNANISFKWNKTVDAYDVWMHHRPARAAEGPGVQRASTVIVQYVKEHDSGYGDKFGGRTPMADTVGSGTGLVVRDGRAYPITWKRPSKGEATTYLDAKGKPIALDPGQVWIVLKDRTRPVQVLPRTAKVKPSPTR